MFNTGAVNSFALIAMHNTGRFCSYMFLCSVFVGCSSAQTSGSDSDGSRGSTASGPGTGNASGDPSSGTDDNSSGPFDNTTAGARFDVPDPSEDLCKASDDSGDAAPRCTHGAPPGSFSPQLQWEWWGEDDEIQSSVIPLVANLTDDNGDDEIDLCDTPDVVVLSTAETLPYTGGLGSAYILDGATGSLHFRISEDFNTNVTPALGDINGDGVADLVAALLGGYMAAFSHDGQELWRTEFPHSINYSISLSDIDADGDVEIIAGNQVLDHNGQSLLNITMPGYGTIAAMIISANFAADLDEDGDMEILVGPNAFHHDGTPYYVHSELPHSYPQVADLDGDLLAEVILTNKDGITMLEHDGSITHSALTPAGDAPVQLNWVRPATIHDFGGDQQSEVAMSSGSHYSVFDEDFNVVWTANVSEPSCCAAGTAFDFLGDATAEAVFSDELQLFVFDGTGQQLLNPTPSRTSWTNQEYPVVADVDNDSSAEILIVSNRVYDSQSSATLQVIRDAEDRWVSTRRIWNQHAYHVTNVREDGTIPQVEKHWWKDLNTFRTNAQIEGNIPCDPEPM